MGSLKQKIRRCFPSPACGRRWREAPDEGSPMRRPHPNPLPQRERGFYAPPPAVFNQAAPQAFASSRTRRM